MPLRLEQLQKIYQTVRVIKKYEYKPVRNNYNMKLWG